LVLRSDPQELAKFNAKERTAGHQELTPLTQEGLEEFLGTKTVNAPKIMERKNIEALSLQNPNLVVASVAKAIIHNNGDRSTSSSSMPRASTLSTRWWTRLDPKWSPSSRRSPKRPTCPSRSRACVTLSKSKLRGHPALADSPYTEQFATLGHTNHEPMALSWATLRFG